MTDKIAQWSHKQFANRIVKLDGEVAKAIRDVFAQALYPDEHFDNIVFRLGEDDELVMKFRLMKLLREKARAEALKRVGPLPDDLREQVVARLREKAQVAHA